MSVPSNVINDIIAQARAYNLDPRLALADAQVESGLNPRAVGDNGTSFGLFQLHQGGELGSLSPAQAFNPTTNAHVSLGVMSQVAAAHPGASPGEIAALAQRPANPSAYAAQVNAVYDNPKFLPSVTPQTQLYTGSGNVDLTGGSTPSGATTGMSLNPLSALWTPPKGVATKLLIGIIAVGSLLIAIDQIAKPKQGALQVVVSGASGASGTVRSARRSAARAAAGPNPGKGRPPFQHGKEGPGKAGKAAAGDAVKAAEVGA